jgi:hypothetical protein
MAKNNKAGKRNEKKPKRDGIIPEAWQSELIAEVEENYDGEFSAVMLEPRAWLDHAIQDVVRDVVDGSFHVVYSYPLLVKWTALSMVYANNNYTQWCDVVEKYKQDVDDGIRCEAEEFVEYNTMRAIPYMGTNRPMIQAESQIKW